MTNSDLEDQTAATGSQQIDHNHPLYIHASDTQGAVLISIKLVGSENCSLWSKSMRIVLLGKNKLGFVLGTRKKEKYDESLHELWDRCNAIVLAWIMNTVSSNLLSSVIYSASSAHRVWEDLRERFDKVNASRSFYLHKEIVTLTQGSTSVSTYFSTLRDLWDELETVASVPGCACSESKRFAEHFQLQKLWQFLVGHNETFEQAKAQVLMTTPTPTVNQAYAMIINIESQRMIGSSSGVNSVTTSLESTVLMSSRNTSGNASSNASGYKGSTSGNTGGSRPRQFYKKSSVVCDECGYNGHIREGCFNLIGYPPDWKHKKKQSGTYSRNSSNNAYTPGEATSIANYAGSQASDREFNLVANTNSAGSSTGSNQAISQDQLHQILQYINKGKAVADSSYKAAVIFAGL